MGWSGYIKSTNPVQQVIAEIIAPYKTESGYSTTIYHHSEGPEWARQGVKRLDKHAEIEFQLYLVREAEGTRWLEVHLIGAHDGTWMVKGMGEECGPYAQPESVAACRELLEGLQGHPPAGKNGEKYRRALSAKAENQVES